jgi:arginine decarboxylase
MYRGTRTWRASRGWPEPEWGGLGITVVAAAGEGQTALSAFDAALETCGAHNYNLIPLSSVIPPAATISIRDAYCAPGDEFGHKLYVVKAEMRSETPGAVVAAGIGWFQLADRRGCFVEHEVSVPQGSREAVETALSEQIHASLHDLAARRGIALAADRFCTHIVSTRVGERPACALVLAVYEAEGWSVSAGAAERSQP